MLDDGAQQSRMCSFIEEDTLVEPSIDMMPHDSGAPVFDEPSTHAHHQMRSESKRKVQDPSRRGGVFDEWRRGEGFRGGSDPCLGGPV